MERLRNKRTHRHRYRDIRSGVGSLIVYLMKNRVCLCLKNKRDIRLWTLESVKSLEPIVVAFYTLTWLNFGAQWSIWASGKIHFKIHSKTRARSSCRFLSVNFWFPPEATSRPDTVFSPVFGVYHSYFIYTHLAPRSHVGSDKITVSLDYWKKNKMNKKIMTSLCFYIFIVVYVPGVCKRIQISR